MIRKIIYADGSQAIIEDEKNFTINIRSGKKIDRVEKVRGNKNFDTLLSDRFNKTLKGKNNDS